MIRMLDLPRWHHVTIVDGDWHHRPRSDTEGRIGHHQLTVAIVVVVVVLFLLLLFNLRSRTHNLDMRKLHIIQYVAPSISAHNNTFLYMRSLI